MASHPPRSRRAPARWSGDHLDRPEDAAERAPGGGRRAVVLLGLAFAAIYLIWGSTYLAIAWSVETMPPLLMMVVFEWARPGGSRPSARVLAGITAGMAGVALLVRPGGGAAAADVLAAGGVLVAALAWAAGSIYARGARLPRSHALAAGMQLLAGGVLLIVAGVAVGEAGALDVAGVTVRSLLALLYLIVFGSLVAYSAYLWLLLTTTPARVATHAFVNPAVAVALGWFAGEAVSWLMLVAGSLILLAIVWITLPSPRQRGQRTPSRGRARRPRHWWARFGSGHVQAAGHRTPASGSTSHARTEVLSST